MKENSSLAYYLLLILVSFFAFFANNHLIPVSEGERVVIGAAKEMVATGNYMVPAAGADNPLPVWIAAGVEHLLPDNTAAQRCAAGVAALWTVIFLYLLVLRMSASRNIAITSALILATTYNVIMQGRTATADIYGFAFMLGAIYFMVRGIASRCRGTGWMVLSGIFMGCSLLSKGLLPFFTLLLPMLVSYAVVLRPGMARKGIPVLVMVVTSVVASLWWYGWLYLSQQGVALGIAGDLFSNNGTRFWYYLGFPVQSGIWALMWLTAIIYFFAKRRHGRHRRLFAFSMVWFICCLVMVSILPERRTQYLLPVLTAGALTTALYLWNLARNPSSRTDRIIFRWNGAAMALALIAIPVLLYIKFIGLVPLSLFIVIAICYLVLALVIIRSLLRKGSRMGIKSVFASVIIAVMAFQAFCLPAAGSLFTPHGYGAAQSSEPIDTGNIVAEEEETPHTGSLTSDD